MFVGNYFKLKHHCIRDYLNDYDDVTEVGDVRICDCGKVYIYKNRWHGFNSWKELKSHKKEKVLAELGYETEIEPPPKGALPLMNCS